MKIKRFTVYEVRNPNGHIVEGGNTQSDAIFNALKECTPKELSQCKLCEVKVQEYYFDGELIDVTEFIQRSYSIHIESLNEPILLDGIRIELR